MPDGNNTNAPSELPVIAALKGLTAAQVKPISGEASVSEKSGYLAELVAYSALDNALSAVADAVADRKPRGVLIVEDRALLHSTWAYESIASEVDRFRRELDWLHDSLTEVSAPPQEAFDKADSPVSKGLAATVTGVGLLANPAAAALITAVGAVPNLVGAVADVVGMFRTEYASAGRSMSPQGTPVVAEMSRLLRNRKIVNMVEGYGVARGSTIAAAIDQLRLTRERIEEKLSPHRQAVLLGQAELDVARADCEAFRTAVIKALSDGKAHESLDERHRAAQQRMAAIQAALVPRSALVSQADKIVTTFDAFVVGVTTATKEGGDPPLLGALLREALFAGGDAGAPMSHVLFVSLDSIGVDIIEAVKRFGTNQLQTYVGGLQVSYLLLDVKSGETTDTGTVRRLSRAEFSPGTGELSKHWTRPVAGPGPREPEL